jgi:hypothetical protein
MYELKKLERYLRVNLLGPGPSSYKKIIYRAAVSQRLGNTDLEKLAAVTQAVAHLLPQRTEFEPGDGLCEVSGTGTCLSPNTSVSP